MSLATMTWRRVAVHEVVMEFLRSEPHRLAASPKLHPGKLRDRLDDVSVVYYLALIWIAARSAYRCRDEITVHKVPAPGRSRIEHECGAAGLRPPHPSPC